MTLLLAASTPHHAHVVAPLRTLLRRRGHDGVIVYGGRPRPWWHPTGARWIGRYVTLRGLRRDRRLMLAEACRTALRRHAPAAVIVTSARYHLEQTFLRVSTPTPVLLYHSAIFMEATVADGRRDAGPRLEYYDAADMILTQGAHLRDQLIAHGVRPERIRVIGCPWLEELCG